MKIKSKVWLEKDNQMIFGAGKSLILKAIDRTGSINQAAKELDMSYRHTWSYLRVIEERLGKPLVIKLRGGSGGGGAALTEYAKDLLKKFDIFEEEVKKAADKKFKEIFIK